MKLEIQELSDKVLIIQAHMVMTDEQQQLLDDSLVEHGFKTIWMFV